MDGSLEEHMKLCNFFRSGTSHRLRIALRPKGLEVDYVPVDLRTLRRRAPNEQVDVAA